MTNFNKDDKNDDMSIEDILASIRKYVVDDGENNQSKDEQQQDTSTDINQNGIVINLEKSQISEPDNSEQQEMESEESSTIMYTKSEILASNTSTNPIGKLTNALKSYGSTKKQDKSPEMLTIDKFLEKVATPMIEKWLENNMEQIVERMVDREIEKLKNESSS
jgi:cell pole-organizing protein PopZ